MRLWLALTILAVALLLSTPRATAAQEANRFLPAGTMAPDISVQAATRYGVMSEPVRLSDLRGETVVLAFFFRVRGGG